MSFEAYVFIGITAFVILIVCIVIFKYLPKRLKHEKLGARWKQVQQRCSDEAQWPQAIIEADNLLVEVLKNKRYKGTSAGERLVAAQKDFSNNDAVWYGHKLRTKIDTNSELKLSKEEVQKALLGLRQGLKDIGALK